MVPSGHNNKHKSFVIMSIQYARVFVLLFFPFLIQKIPNFVCSLACSLCEGMCV